MRAIQSSRPAWVCGGRWQPVLRRTDISIAVPVIADLGIAALAGLTISLGGSLVLSVALPGPAAAQSREIYIGGTGGRSGPYAPPMQRPYRERRQSETDGLLEDALDDLSRGRLLDARRLLELVVEQFPSTPAADEARRLLAPIYASGRGPNSPAPGVANVPAVSPQRTTPQAWDDARGNSGREFGRDSGRADAPLDAPANAPWAETKRAVSAPFAAAPGADLDAAAERQWQTEVRRVRALDQDFRSNIGDRVFFGESSTELGSHSRVVLAAQARWLMRHPDVSVVVEAHADDPGNLEFNQNLAA